MKDLDRIEAFVRVAERGSFLAAARDLKVSASVVSKLISLLEEEMGIHLLRRSTRRLALTDAGTDFYSNCAAALNDIRLAKEMAAEHSDASKGVIKIQATFNVGLKILGPAIREFMTRFPDVSFKVSLSDVPSRVIDSGYDIVMIHRPSSNEKSVTCRTFRRVRFLICASQDYIAKYGEPKKPVDLVGFNCLINEKQVRPNEWRFREGHKDITVRVQGNLLFNDSIALHDAVLHGMGIARLPDYHVTSDVERGGICVLFDNVLYDTRTITAAYPRTKFMPMRVTAFLDFLDDFIPAEKPSPV